MIRSIIAAIVNAMRRTLRAVVRGVGKAARTTWEWAEEYVPPAWTWAWSEAVPAAGRGLGKAVTGTANAVGSVASIIPNAISGLLGGGRGSGIEPPAAQGQPAAEQRREAADGARCDDAGHALALATRSAARALLRGEEPAQVLPKQIDRWLRSLSGSELTYLSALRPERVQGVLGGQGTAQVPAYRPDALHAPNPAMSADELPPREDAARSALRSRLSMGMGQGARERQAARAGQREPGVAATAPVRR